VIRENIVVVVKGAEHAVNAGTTQGRNHWQHYAPFFVQLMFVISLCVSYLVVQSPRSEEVSSLQASVLFQRFGDPRIRDQDNDGHLCRSFRFSWCLILPLSL
jgi:hypothetical protein